MSIPKTTKFTLKRIVENLDKMSPEKGFGKETAKLTSEQKKKLLNMSSMFESFGECLKQEEKLMNSAKQLTEFCELAEIYAITDAGDWFQKEIVMKDMKQLKSRLTEFQKLTKQCYATMQQLGVTYDDMKHILSRYYDLQNTNPTSVDQLLNTPESSNIEDDGIESDDSNGLNKL